MTAQDVAHRLDRLGHTDIATLVRRGQSDRARRILELTGHLELAAWVDNKLSEGAKV